MSVVTGRVEPMFEVRARSLDRHHAVISAESAAMLAEIAEFDEQELWRHDGATSMTGWLAGRYGLVCGTARECVRVANALRYLPAIAAAHAAGRLSFDQLKALTRFVTADEDVVWARRGPEMAPSKLWAEARRREQVRTEQVEEDARERSLWMQWDEDGRFLRFEGKIPAEQAAPWEQAVLRAAEDVTVEDGVHDREGARLLDAMVGLTCSAGKGSPPSVLVVHTELGVLAGAPEGETPRLAETESGVRLAEESVRRMACDATVDWVLHAGGVPVGMGRKTRSVPPRLLRLLRHRDRGCRFPGCGRKRWLKAHHIRHWGRGGATDLDNLVLLCHAHHRLVHEGGWSIRGDPNGRLRFHDPGGRERPARAGPQTALEVAV
jgi:hypothetical protein